jgi:ribosomal protein L30E
MGIKKFINSVKESLGLDEFDKKSKKKAVKSLLKKLNEKQAKLLVLLDNKKINKKQKKEFQEELDIINVQIHNGEKILNKLDA